MSSEREQQLEDIIARFLQPMKGIPFEVVIKSLYGARVLPFDNQQSSHQELLRQLVQGMRSVCQAVQRNPIERPRLNEVGNDFEPFVIEALKQLGLDAAAPKTKSGKGKSTGYPDVRIKTTIGPVFLEVKTYAAANHDTTQRSFYLSPTDEPKVHEDGIHLLVGFEVKRLGNRFSPVGFTLIDLYGLNCDMKFEFNSDNKRLYEARRMLHSETV